MAIEDGGVDIKQFKRKQREAKFGVVGCVLIAIVLIVCGMALVLPWILDWLTTAWLAFKGR